MAFCKKTLLRKWAFLQRPFPKKSGQLDWNRNDYIFFKEKGLTADFILGFQPLDSGSAK